MREVLEDATTGVDLETTMRDTPVSQHADGRRRALAAYGVQRSGAVERLRRRGRHARPADRRPGVTAALAGLVLCGASTAALLWPGGGTGPQAPPPAQSALEVEFPPVPATLLPGRTVTGAVLLTNRQRRPVEVADVAFRTPTSDACPRPGVSLAATLPPTPESALEVPAGGTSSIAWTAYMDGDSDDACQGATLTSVVSLDGEPAGTVTLTAGQLEPPPAPTGGLTTSTRAAVLWSPSSAADPGWVVERAVAGTAEWEPACDSSAERSIRALSCTDTSLTASTAYVYRVTLRTGRWQVTSRPSTPITTQARPSA